jgi:EmrB/QacA subfamily drug resistance transporter
MIERARRAVRGEHHHWWALGTVALGTFMSTLDSSSVNVSLPVILRYFDSDLATIQWVVLAYLLTITALLLTFGRLADIWGRKRVYTIGFGVFTLGSLCCALSGSPGQLIAARVLQAVGGAMVQANGLAITSAVFPEEQRGRALGIQGTVVATGTTLGPSFGGLLTGWFGWQTNFLLNVPVGLFGIGLALLVLEERRISTRRPGAGRFDPAGAVLAAITLVTLILALNRGGTVGWGSPPILGLLAVAAVGFAGFLIVEARVAAPLISLALFRIRSFATGSAAAFLSFLAMSGHFFLMPFFLQLALGYPPGRAGLLLTPTSLTLAVVAPLSGYLSERLGARILSSIGLSISCVALFLLSRLTVDVHYLDVLGRLILLGVGMGLFNSPNSSAVFASVPRAQYGVVGGFLSMVRNSGQAIGQAVVGAIVVSAIAPVVGGGGLDALRASVGGAEVTPLLNAFLTGLRRAYLLAALLAACGAVISLLRGPRAVAAQAASPEPAPGGAAQNAD